LLRAALAPAGYEVTALSSPLGLLQAIEKLEPDLIVVAAVALLEEMRNLRSLLRRMAMDRKMKLAELAQKFVDAADLLELRP
jgi:AmiR/NasT family two-component response regulator